MTSEEVVEEAVMASRVVVVATTGSVDEGDTSDTVGDDGLTGVDRHTNVTDNRQAERNSEHMGHRSKVADR